MKTNAIHKMRMFKVTMIYKRDTQMRQKQHKSQKEGSNPKLKKDQKRKGDIIERCESVRRFLNGACSIAKYGHPPYRTCMTFHEGVGVPLA